MNNRETDTRYILWTGGVDSTFMLLKYAREDLTLQPIYVIDPKRVSTQYEIKAMDSIADLLKKKYAKDVNARIMPLKIYEVKDIPSNDFLTKCFIRLSSKMKIGSQYEWLSRLAVLYPSLDIGVEKHIDAFGGCTTAIMNDGGFIDVNGIGQLNAEKASKETEALFGKFRFPIYHYTETEMFSMVHSWGWDEIIKKTWFCHNPINGKPCGICRPCQQKMEDCQQGLLPNNARKRYKIYALIKHIAGERVAMKTATVYRHFRK